MYERVIDQDNDLADIHAADLKDTESEDCDIEEADYASSHGLLCSPINDDADKPALRDSLLLQDTELSEEQRIHSQKVWILMMNQMKHIVSLMFNDMLMIIHRALLSQLTTTTPSHCLFQVRVTHSAS